MAERCLKMSCPEVVRLALVDPCTGIATAGASNGYAVACPRNFTFEPVTREGDTSEFISDCGFVVATDRQDDQLTGWNISWEQASRSNELESLVTGSTLIASGGTNIGNIHQATANCSAPTDTRFDVEVFYKLNRCVSGANHVRYFVPNVQFKVTELDKEGTLTYYRYSATSFPGLSTGIGNGPYNDFPADVTAAVVAIAGSEVYLTHIDFEETITIAGQCGFLTVPAQ